MIRLKKKTLENLLFQKLWNWCHQLLTLELTFEMEVNPLLLLFIWWLQIYDLGGEKDQEVNLAVVKKKKNRKEEEEDDEEEGKKERKDSVVAWTSLGLMKPTRPTTPTQPKTNRNNLLHTFKQNVHSMPFWLEMRMEILIKIQNLPTLPTMSALELVFFFIGQGPKVSFCCFQF